MSAGILVVVATGLAQIVSLVLAATHAASRETRAILLAVEKLEQLNSLTWTRDPISLIERSDLTTDLSVDPLGAAGRGLAPTAPGTLDRNVSGAVDFLDRDGKWLGTGSTPPVGSVHVRRWAIRPLGPTDAGLLVLQVVVIPVRLAGPATSAIAATDPGVVWLTTARLRR